MDFEEVSQSMNSNLLFQLIPDLKRYLMTFLSPVDGMSLRLCSRFTHDNFPMPSFKEIFKRRIMKIFGSNGVPENAENFCQALQSSGAMVSGSFIPDCIMGTSYHQDIDIYDWTGSDMRYGMRHHFTPGESRLQFMQYLYQNDFKQEMGYEDFITPRTRYFSHQSRCHVKKVNNGIKYVIGKEDKFKIQIIPVALKQKEGHRSPIKRLVWSSFDLDICKNLFNGEKLYVRSWRKLIYKYDEILPTGRFIMSWYGHDIKGEEKIPEQRAAKYRKRKFQITRHSRYEEIAKYVDHIMKKNGIRDTIEEWMIRQNILKMAILIWIYFLAAIQNPIRFRLSKSFKFL